MTSHHNQLVSAFCLYVCAGFAQAAAPSFHILGSDQIPFLEIALSGNGERVVGNFRPPSSTQFETAYIDWRSSLSPTILQPGARLSPSATSFDGGVIVGTAFTSATRPFRYVNNTLTYIDFFPGSSFAYCSDVSGDGETIIGKAWEPGVGISAAAWNVSTGWSFLPHLDTVSCRQAEASAISGNGQLVVGSAHHCGEHGTVIEYEAVAWNPTLAALGWQENTFATVAQGISADGATIVGHKIISIGGGYESPLDYAPCRWTSAGIEYLALPQFNSYSSANDVSADGMIIVGLYNSAAFIWIGNEGMYNLNTYAQNLGVDLNGWTLASARAISDDGRVILGSAEKQGTRTAFVLDLGSPCIADYNHDGIADLFDYLEFVQDFAAGNTAADVNNDQVIDFFDYLDFVQVFSTGC